MPGGNLEAYKALEPIFNSIAAKVEGEPCSTYIGGDGAGHYVKMVHNGIEYGDMQLISEAYYLLKNLGGLSNPELADVFEKWNLGELNSYLIEITSNIFNNIDQETKRYTLDIIKDKAGQKGTGKWASQSALELGVAAPTITEAVFARCLSFIKDERINASKILKGPVYKYEGNVSELIEGVRRALYASKICSYAQGFNLIKVAAEIYNWDIDLGKISMIFRGGCIIRAQFLHNIRDAYIEDKKLDNLMLSPYFSNILNSYEESWRNIAIEAFKAGIPVPGITSALTYYDSYRSASLPANLIQAQRDYFGAHTYERVDKEGIFHSKWF